MTPGPGTAPAPDSEPASASGLLGQGGPGHADAGLDGVDDQADAAQEPTDGAGDDDAGRDDADWVVGAGGTPSAPLVPSRRLEVVCALVALSITATLVVLSRRIVLRTELDGIDPRWWPEMLGLVGSGLSLALLVVVLRAPMPRDHLDATGRAGWFRFGAGLVLSVGFIVTWPLVGFVVAAPFYLAALTAAFGGRGWKALVVFPIGITAFTHVLFRVLLSVPL